MIRPSVCRMGSSLPDDRLGPLGQRVALPVAPSRPSTAGWRRSPRRSSRRPGAPLPLLQPRQLRRNAERPAVRLRPVGQPRRPAAAGSAPTCRGVAFGVTTARAARSRNRARSDRPAARWPPGRRPGPLLRPPQVAHLLPRGDAALVHLHLHPAPARTGCIASSTHAPGPATHGPKSGTVSVPTRA